MECLLHAGNHVRCSGYSGEQTAQNKKHPRLYDATILAGGVGEWPCYKPTAECVLEGVWQWGHRPTFVLTGPTRFFSPGHLQWGFRDAKFFTPFRRLEVQDEGAGRCGALWGSSPGHVCGHRLASFSSGHLSVHMHPRCVYLSLLI